MILVKHAAVSNFDAYEGEEKKDLVMQELTKAYLLYPRAIADVLDNCNIVYKSMGAKDLEAAVKNNAGNLKMLNKIVRISFLVNKNGGQTLENHDREISYRELMKKGKSWVKEHHNHMKEATLLSREMMREEAYSPLMGKIMHTYLNMDGQASDPEVEQAEQKVIMPKSSVKPPMTTGKKILIGLGVLAAAGAIYYGVSKLMK
jgi:hypothetical protein